MALRVSQAIVAALSMPNVPHVLATTLSVDVMAQLASNIRASAVQLGALSQSHATLYASSVQLDALARQAPPILATAIRLEILVWSFATEMPPVFPTLPGLAFSTVKRPKFFNSTATAASGREVNVAYANAPLWEWDLTYEYLPDEATGSGATNSDLRTLLGFYLAQGGSLFGFLFKDPDDHAVTGQTLGVTDGSTLFYTLVRGFGGGDGVGTEPIGYLDTSSPLNVYLDGVRVDPSLYSVLMTQPVYQQIKFGTAPPAGQAVTVDMNFYYYARFKDDSVDFEKFMDRLWSVRTVTLLSKRG